MDKKVTVSELKEKVDRFISEREWNKYHKPKDLPISIENVKKVVAKRENNAECQHSLGYLKKRPKDMSIPDERLTRSKMIECLLHQKS